MKSHHHQCHDSARLILQSKAEEVGTFSFVFRRPGAALEKLKVTILNTLRKGWTNSSVKVSLSVVSVRYKNRSTIKTLKSPCL